MPLVPLSLALALEQRWLARAGSSDLPSSAAESADRFAEVVSQWFTTATAAGFPCLTALARKSQLAAMTQTALTSPSPEVAGAQLGVAVASYIAGQAFGVGVAGMPIATAAAIAGFAAVFADLEAETRERASLLALGCWGLALSTLVTFTGPLPPAPII